MKFISGVYTSLFSRFLHSFFVEMPAEVWMRWLSLVIPTSAKFINCTSVSDAVLMDAWKQAQTNLGTKSFPSDAYNGAPHPADPRALNVQPTHVTVVSVPDTSIADLVKVDPAWGKDKNPSGAIIVAKGQGFMEYNTCHAMTMPWVHARVYAAASEIPAVLEYEFENCIMSKLGYDVGNR
jgi:hypothetical protein